MIRLLLFLLCVAPAVASPTDAAYLAYLTKVEGYCTVPYQSAGDWHVGIGHDLSAHGEHPRASYTAAEIKHLFQHDLVIAIMTCRDGVRDFDSLPNDVQLVTVGLAFNCGPLGFRRWTGFRFALGHRAFNAAASEVGQSLWARQVGASRFNGVIHVLLRQ